MSTRSGLEPILLLGTLVAGCGRPAPDASASVDTAMVDDSVAVTLEAPASVPPGAPVTFRVALANPTTRPVMLYLLGREVTFDISVSGPDGAEVWRRLEDSAFQEILAVRTLAPRERIVREAEWPGGRQVGNYTATAKVLTDGAPLQSSPIRFEVKP